MCQSRTLKIDDTETDQKEGAREGGSVNMRSGIWRFSNGRVGFEIAKFSSFFFVILETCYTQSDELLVTVRLR